MRICFVGTPWLAVGPMRGGIQKAILELSRMLARNHEVHILCPAPATKNLMPDGGGPRFHYANVGEVATYPIPERIGLDLAGLELLARMAFATVAIFGAYARLRRNHRPDITVFASKFVAFPILLVFHRRRRGIFVYSEQNIWPWLYAAPPTMLSRLRYTTNVGLGMLVIRWSDAIHALSDSIRIGLLAHGAIGKPIATIPNGVGVTPREENPVSLTEPLRVAFVGRLVEDKGVPLLIDVIRRVAASGRHIRLLVFGDGPLRDRLSEVTGEYCVLLGEMPRDEVLKALRTVQIVLFLAPVENIPSHALLEALALGKAVVATNVGDTARFLLNRQNAMLCDPDPDAVLRAIFTVVDDSNLYAQLSSGAKALAAENSWEEIAQRHLTVLASWIQLAAAK